MAVVDTAAQISIMSHKFWNKCYQHETCGGVPLRVRNAEASSYMQCTLVHNIEFSIDDSIFHHDVAVGPIADDFIIGLDFLLQQKAVIDLQSGTVLLDNHSIIAHMVRTSSGDTYHVATITALGNQSLPPFCTRAVKVHLSNKSSVPFVTSAIATPAVVAAACLLNGNESAHFIEVTNDSSNTALLRDGEVITTAIEADVLDPFSPTVASSSLCQNDPLPSEDILAERNQQKPFVADTVLILPLAT